jgi:hypothetical protein
MPIQSLKVKKINLISAYNKPTKLVNWNVLCRIFSNTRRIQRSLEYLSLDWTDAPEFFNPDNYMQKKGFKATTSEFLVSSIVSLKNLRYL